MARESRPLGVKRALVAELVECEANDSEDRNCGGGAEAQPDNRAARKHDTRDDDPTGFLSAGGRVTTFQAGVCRSRGRVADALCRRTT